MLDELETLSLKELKDLRGKVERMISTYEDRKRREALHAAETAAREHGFSLSDLTGAPKGRKGSAVAPKYANPQDAAMTWTGRGRKPHWVQENIDRGLSLEDMLI